MVFGGYGVFGARVCEELTVRGLEVSVVGRNAGRAQALADRLRSTGAAARGFAGDATRPDLEAIARHDVVACCAGPFSKLGTTLVEACIAAGTPYVDLSDDRAQVADVFRLDAKLRAKGLAAVPACSSLPAVSGALALALAESRVDRPERARVTLFIGNRNRKGAAAIRSAVGVIGRPIIAPQGMLRGFSDGAVVELPPPFGHRRAYIFESPDYDMLPPILGVSALEVRVGFEFALAGATFALLATLGSRWDDGVAWLLSALGKPFGFMGHAGGAIMAELFWPDGERRFAALSSTMDGQRLAALPCALVAARLAERRIGDPVGAIMATELLGVQSLLDGLRAEGSTLTMSD